MNAINTNRCSARPVILQSTCSARVTARGDIAFRRAKPSSRSPPALFTTARYPGAGAVSWPSALSV